MPCPCLSGLFTSLAVSISIISIYRSPSITMSTLESLGDFGLLPLPSGLNLGASYSSEDPNSDFIGMFVEQGTSEYSPSQVHRFKLLIDQLTMDCHNIHLSLSYNGEFTVLCNCLAKTRILCLTSRQPGVQCWYWMYW